MGKGPKVVDHGVEGLESQVLTRVGGWEEGGELDQAPLQAQDLDDESSTHEHVDQQLCGAEVQVLDAPRDGLRE